jgi:hypothetical protein
MNAWKSALHVAVSVVMLLVRSSVAQTPASGAPSDWQAVVQRRLPLYGRRNWIVVADSPFPVFASPGIETIVVNANLASVQYVASAICSSRHVRATVFLHQELQLSMSTTIRE